MNTLQIIKKQINKASAVHDAQITHTAYRGVKCEVHQPVKSLTALSAIAVVLVSDMGALQITGIVSLSSVAFLSLIYGEIKVLSK